MRPVPKDWPRISSALYYEDAEAAIAWLGWAFGFEPRLVVEGEGGVRSSTQSWCSGTV
jgi:hypothetical protein